jgi:benzoate membrane transport protein
MAPLANALSISLATDEHRAAAITAFAVTASGLTLFGIGGAFWGLVAGIAVTTLDRIKRR